MKKAILSLTFGLLLVLTLADASVFSKIGTKEGAANVTAAKVVEGLHSLLIESMKAGTKKSCSDRFTMLKPYILDSFDFPLISRIVLGRHWRDMDEKKRQEFVDAFAHMTIATYASRFDSWSGESFRTIYAGPDERGHVKVETVLVKSDGDRISLDYTCRQKDGKWKIVAVAARGVNDLSVKRAAYASFLKNHSIDELIARLDEYTSKCISTFKVNSLEHFDDNSLK